MHRHNREAGWTETITLPNGGSVRIKDSRGIKTIKAEKLLIVSTGAGEAFGLTNIDQQKPLYFFSKMKPGFTGYGEIEEVKG